MSFCPVCRQGLPDPPERFCPSCGTDLAANPPGPEPPAEPLAESPPPVEPPPPPPELPQSPGAPPPPPPGGTAWDRREQIGFVPALFETTKDVLAKPTAFFRQMPLAGGIGSPLVYGLILGYIGVVATALYGTIFWSVMGTAMPTFGRHGQLDQILPLVQGGASLAAQLLLGPIRVLLVLFVLSGIFHVMLLLFGNARQGFETTFRVVSFGQATAVLNLVPFCGGILAPIYLIVVSIIGLSETHGISRGSAATAVLLPILLVCCCCGLAVFAGIGMLGGLAGLMGQAH